MTRRRDPLPLPQLLPWEASLIALAGDQPPPEYGSPDWHALPADSPVRVASCVRAAAAWRTTNDPAEIAHRLRVELAEAAELERLEHDLDDWTPILTSKQRAGYARPGPSQLELARRRNDDAAAERARAQLTRIAIALPLRQEGAA